MLNITQYMGQKQKMFMGRGAEFIYFFKVMPQKLYVVVGILSMLLASYATLAAKDVRGDLSKEDNQDDYGNGSAEVEGGGIDAESVHEGKCSISIFVQWEPLVG